jgi:diguanylate cyclase (GGDEF)-like protein
MQQAPIMLSIVLGLSGFLAIFLATWAKMHERVPATHEFFWLFLCVAIYSLGYSLEIAHNDIHSVLIAIRVEYFGLSFIGPLLLLFTLHFMRGRPLPHLLTAALMLIPVCTLVLVQTITWHDLFYINPRIDFSGYFPVLVFERGIWYYVHFIYLLLTTISGMVLMVIHAFRAKQKKKKQAVAMAIGSFVPIFMAVLYIMDLIPGKVDPGSFALITSGAIYSFTLFQLDLFDLVPVARKLALDSIQDGFLVVDRNHILLDFNEAVRNLPGVKHLKLGDNLLENKILGENLKPLLKKETNRVNFSLESAEQGIFFYTADSHRIEPRLFSKSGISILIRDVSETTYLMNKLSNQANMDDLTGLLNRRYLMQLGERQLALMHQKNRQLGIILLDIDHFKAINDHYGHLAGDEVLKQLAHCIESSLRDNDLVGRYGGEEFVIFLPGSDLTTSLQIGERIRQGIENLVVEYENTSIRITISLGVQTTTVGNRTTMTELLKQADQALYQAKDNGRNCVCAFPEA